MGGNFIRYSDDAKQGGTAYISKERNKIQHDLDKTQNWAETKIIKFNREIHHFACRQASR